jgi:hypothetical protein
MWKRRSRGQVFGVQYEEPSGPVDYRLRLMELIMRRSARSGKPSPCR